MGSGKTIVALSVVLYAIGPGWEEARSTLGEWSNRAVNNDPVRGERVTFITLGFGPKTSL